MQLSQRYRQLANEAFLAAGRIVGAEERRMMERIAEFYSELAMRAEQRERSAQQPDKSQSRDSFGDPEPEAKTAPQREPRGGFWDAPGEA